MKTQKEKYTVLVAGASGATGRLLVDQLLLQGHRVKAIVRTPEQLPDFMKNRDRLEIIEASILELSDDAMSKLVKDCDAIASCLGHNLTFKGVFGHPRRLVTDAVRRLCSTSIKSNSDKKIKFVLMNTTGNRNHDINEKISIAQGIVIHLLRWMLPPHADNEEAADYLRTEIGQNHKLIEWVVVRPDGLIDQNAISEYTLHTSPTRSAIFDAGKTSRINVGHFMASLISDQLLWSEWKGQMPVIYNKS